MTVASALGLYVSCGRHELLENQRAAPSGGRVESRRGANLLVRAQHGDAASPTAISSLQSDGITMSGRECHDRLGIRDRFGDSGNRSDSGALGSGPSAHLVAQCPHGRRRRAHPDDTGVGDRLSEGVVLGQESVTRMHRIGTGGAGHGQDRIGVGVRRALRQSMCLVSEFGGRAHEVLGGVREDGCASQVPDCAHHAQGDLTTIGDKDAVECPDGHLCAPRVRRPSARDAGPCGRAGTPRARTETTCSCVLGGRSGLPLGRITLFLQ